MSETPSKPPPFGEMSTETYATYRDERNRLTDAEKDYANQFDKYILTLSGGAIGLSIAFLRDLVGDHPIQGAGLLIGAWVFLALAAGMVVFGLFLNPISQARYRRILDEQAQDGGERYWARVRAAQSKCRLPKIISALNFASVFAFLLGLALLLGFAYGSVKTKGLDMSKSDKNIPGWPADKPFTGSRGPAMGPVDRPVTTDALIPDGRAGAPPALGPVDRVTVTPAPAPSQPTTAPSGSQPAAPPPSTPGK